MHSSPTHAVRENVCGTALTTFSCTVSQHITDLSTAVQYCTVPHRTNIFFRCLCVESGQYNSTVGTHSKELIFIHLNASVEQQDNYYTDCTAVAVRTEAILRIVPSTVHILLCTVTYSTV